MTHRQWVSCLFLVNFLSYAWEHPKFSNCRESMFRKPRAAITFWPEDKEGGFPWECKHMEKTCISFFNLPATYCVKQVQVCTPIPAATIHLHKSQSKLQLSARETGKGSLSGQKIVNRILINFSLSSLPLCDKGRPICAKHVAMKGDLKWLCSFK